MKINVKQYDWKLKVTINRTFRSKASITRKVRKIMNNFPNYSMYWKNFDQLIVNIYFDETGWDKDRKNTIVKTEVQDRVITIKWEDA